MVDHSKFARKALHELAPLTAFDLIIVDSGIADEQFAEISDLGVPIELARPGIGTPAKGKRPGTG